MPDDITISREGDELLVGRPDDEREHRALHGLTRSLVSNMVVGRVGGLREGAGDRRRRLPRRRRGPRASTCSSASRTRSRSMRPRASVRGPGTDPHHGARHRQATRRPGGRRHPQDPQARALQGQGHPLRRRARAAQGRQVGEVRRRIESDHAQPPGSQGAPSPPRPQEGPRHHGTRPRLARVPFQQAHLRPGHRRRHRHHPGLGVDDGEVLRRRDGNGRRGEEDREARRRPRQRPASNPSCSTVVGSAITGVSPESPTVPAKPV